MNKVCAYLPLIVSSAIGGLFPTTEFTICTLPTWGWDWVWWVTGVSTSSETFPLDLIVFFDLSASISDPEEGLVFFLAAKLFPEIESSCLYFDKSLI